MFTIFNQIKQNLIKNENKDEYILDISDIKIRNKGCEILKSVGLFSLLTQLNLSNNSITSQGMVYITNALKTNKTVKLLNISGNDLCLLDAAKNTTLKSLYMRENFNNPHCIKYIGDALKVNCTSPS